MRIESITGLVADLAKLKIDAMHMRLRRALLARIAGKLPTDLLDDARIAATEELFRRGYHVITYRSQRSGRSGRKVA